jgi:CheY-like chemotaxis protein
MLPGTASAQMIEEKLQKAANELRQIQELLFAEREVDPRVLADFREAVNRVRAVTWAIEQYVHSRQSQQASEKILIADDSRFQVELLSKFLSGKGMLVMSASDGLQAWTMAVRTQPDFIVLDLNMPAGSGIDVLKRLQTSTKTASIPVIGVTGSTDAAAEQNMRAMGAVAFLTKPVDLERLYSIIVELRSKRAGAKAQINPS